MCMYVQRNLNFKIREDLAKKDLELLLIQISNPRSNPFLVGTWYRPFSSALNLFSLFQEITDKIDSENSELYLFGDLNCDLLSHAPNVNTRELSDIFDIYNLTQLITEPTRVTNTSQSLIDLCLTNTPDKVTASSIQSLGISDHSPVYLVRKSTWQGKTINSFVHKRQFKYFNENEFLSELSKIDWNETCLSGDPNVM